MLVDYELRKDEKSRSDDSKVQRVWLLVWDDPETIGS